MTDEASSSSFPLGNHNTSETTNTTQTEATEESQMSKRSGKRLFPAVAKKTKKTNDNGKKQRLSTVAESSGSKKRTPNSNKTATMKNLTTKSIASLSMTKKILLRNKKKLSQKKDHQAQHDII
jgi:hypothetical protein